MHESHGSACTVSVDTISGPHGSGSRFTRSTGYCILILCVRVCICFFDILLCICFGSTIFFLNVLMFNVCVYVYMFWCFVCLVSFHERGRASDPAGAQFHRAISPSLPTCFFYYVFSSRYIPIIFVWAVFAQLVSIGFGAAKFNYVLFLYLLFVSFVFFFF